jgi:hypothetical protein
MRTIAIMVSVAFAATATATAGTIGRRQPAGLTTTISVVRDTIVARVTGTVPASAIRTLVPEMRIAPKADDTTLFTLIREVDVDRRGFIWVYDNPSNSIMLFDSTGRKLRRIGRAGEGPGEFRSNGGMVVMRDGRLAQLDPANARVTFISPAGDIGASWPVRAGFMTSNGLYTDTTGQLYAVRPLFGRGGAPAGGDIPALVRYRNGGEMADTLRPPIFSVPAYTFEARSPTGQMRRNSMGDAPRSLWGWHPNGYYIGGNGATGQIVIARPREKPIRIDRIAPAVPIPAEERRTAEAQLTLGMRELDPGWTLRGAALPANKAPLNALFVARDGRIWARVPGPSVRIAGADVPPESVGLPRGRPLQMFRSQNAWEVYSSTGTFLGRVSIPSNSDLMQADGNRVWLITHDDDGLPSVVRMRIQPALAG